MEPVLLELVNCIRLDTDKGKMPLSGFLDLSKAFDTLDHSLLLIKLTHYWLSQATIQWLSNFLLGRRQLVEFDGTLSILTTTSAGEPQGYILRPLLFIIHTNDITVTKHKLNVTVYAEDTIICISLSSDSI